MSYTSLPQLSSGDTARAIIVAIAARRPCFLHGQPGIGKSAIVAQACEAIASACSEHVDLRDIRAAQLDAVDTRGIPYRVTSEAGERTSWALPDWWPTRADDADRVVIFYDELNRAPTSVLNALLQAILDRRLGTARLPETAAQIAAGNPIDAGVTTLGAAIVNRFVHLRPAPSHADWDSWAIGKRDTLDPEWVRSTIDRAPVATIHPLIVAFFRFRPGLLTEEPARGTLAYTTPRSAHILSDVLHVTRPVQSDGGYDRAAFTAWEWALVVGSIGPAAAEELRAFVAFLGLLPDLRAILADPEGSPIPEGIAVRIAVTTALALSATTATLDAIARYAARLPAEYSTAMALDVQTRHGEALTSHPAYARWVLAIEAARSAVPRR